jgi:hypothetical protein
MKLLGWPLTAVSILTGLATVWLPAPTGVPLLVLGMIIIVGTSRSAALFTPAPAQQAFIE